MPLIDTAPDAVARIYAHSLLEMVKPAGREAVESTLAELEDILEVARADHRFAEFLSSRIVPAGPRGDALERILKGRASDTVRKFLLVLNMKDRLAHLPAITAAYESLVQEAFGRIEVDVYTAHPLGPDSVQSLKGRLADALKRDVIVYPYVDERMIGGVKFRIGDQFIDASVATRLRDLQDKIHRDGASRIRASLGRIVDGQ